MTPFWFKPSCSSFATLLYHCCPNISLKKNIICFKFGTSTTGGGDVEYWPKGFSEWQSVVDPE
jgi:hypothetical protein